MPDDRYMMVKVEILQAIESLQRVSRELDEKLETQAAAHMRFAVHRITDAMEQVVRKNLK